MGCKWTLYLVHAPQPVKHGETFHHRVPLVAPRNAKITINNAPAVIKFENGSINSEIADRDVATDP